MTRSSSPHYSVPPPASACHCSSAPPRSSGCEWRLCRSPPTISLPPRGEPRSRSWDRSRARPSRRRPGSRASRGSSRVHRARVVVVAASWGQRLGATRWTDRADCRPDDDAHGRHGTSHARQVRFVIRSSPSTLGRPRQSARSRRTVCDGDQHTESNSHGTGPTRPLILAGQGQCG